MDSIGRVGNALFIALVLLASFGAAPAPASAVGGAIPGLDAGYWTGNLLQHGFICATVWVPGYAGYDWACWYDGEGAEPPGVTHLQLDQHGRTWGEVESILLAVDVPLYSAKYAVSMVGMIAATPYSGADAESNRDWAMGVAGRILQSGDGEECRTVGTVEQCVYGGTRSGTVRLWVSLSGGADPGTPPHGYYAGSYLPLVAR